MLGVFFNQISGMTTREFNLVHVRRIGCCLEVVAAVQIFLKSTLRWELIEWQLDKYRKLCSTCTTNNV